MKKKTPYQCYQLAALLNEREWEGFLSAVERGKHGQHAASQIFVALLAQAHPKFEVREAELWRKIYPARAFDDGRMRVLRSYLKDMLEAHIVDLELQQSAEHQEALLLKGLQRRGGQAPARKVLRQAARRLEAGKMRIEDFGHAYVLESARLDLFIQSRQRKEAYDWEKLTGCLDQMHLVHRLRLHCAQASAALFVTAKGQAPAAALAATLAQAAALGPDLPPLVALFFHLLSLMTGRESEQHFMQLRHLLATHGPSMDRTERANVFGLLINALMVENHKGRAGSLARIFQVYQEMHRQELIFGAGAFSVSSARNIVSIGARLRAFEWTWAFLDQARKRLPAPSAANVYHHGAAYLLFSEGDYARARQQLRQLDFEDPFYRLAHDNLMLRICYESCAIDLFYNTHTALSRHLYRSKSIAKSVRQATQNLLKVILPMFKLRWEQNSSATTAEIRTQIASFQHVPNRDWLEAKLQELEKN